MQQIGGKYKGASQSDLLRIRKERLLFQTYDPYNRKIAQTVPPVQQAVFQSSLNTLAQVVQVDSSAIPIFSYGFSELFEVTTTKPFVLQALFLTTSNLNRVIFNFVKQPMIVFHPLPQQGGGGLIVTDSPNQYFNSAGKHVLYITGLDSTVGFQLKDYHGIATVPVIPSLTSLRLICGTGGPGPVGLESVADPPLTTNIDFRAFTNLSLLDINSVEFAILSPTIRCSGLSLLQTLNLVGIGSSFDLDISDCPLLNSLDVAYSKVQSITTAGTYPQLTAINTYGSDLTGALLDTAVSAFTGIVAGSGTWTSDQNEPVPFLAGWTWYKPSPPPIVVQNGDTITILAVQVAGYTHFSVTLVGSGGQGGIGGGGGGGAYTIVSGLLSELSFPLTLKAGNVSSNPNMSMSFLTDAHNRFITYAGGGTPGTAIAPGTGGVPYQSTSTSAPGQDGTISAGGVSGGFPLGIYTEYGTGGNPPNGFPPDKRGIAVFSFS